jgi:TM2 domain-containing membrane protein YozV
MAFCTGCGAALASATAACTSCRLIPRSAPPVDDFSPKSYGIAVSLCGIFGVVGIHHFYLGNFVHGLIDLGMFVGAVVCLSLSVPGQDNLWAIGAVLILADALHSAVVFFLLIVGRQRDGNGLLVTYAAARR